MKWMILALRLECNMFGLVEMKQTALPHKKDAEFHDTNHCRKERKAFMTVGSLEVRRLLLLCCKRLNVYEYNFSMQEAVNAPRFHHQWLPDLITFEPTLTHKP
jgi:gamma-glutamyltranspeptidase/glutathione hydrolase